MQIVRQWPLRGGRRCNGDEAGRRVRSCAFHRVVAPRWLGRRSISAAGAPDRAAEMPAADSPDLRQDLAGTVAHTGVDPAFEGRALQNALLRAIAAHRGYC